MIIARTTTKRTPKEVRDAAERARVADIAARTCTYYDCNDTTCPIHGAYLTAKRCTTCGMLDGHYAECATIDGCFGR